MLLVTAIHVPTQNLKDSAGGGTTAELVEQLNTQLGKLAHHNSTVRKGQPHSILRTHLPTRMPTHPSATPPTQRCVCCSRCTVWSDALLHVHHLLASHPFLLSLELSTLLTRTLSTLTDIDKPVRTALLTLLTHLLPSIPPPTFQPFIRLYLTHTCSGLCSLHPSIRRTSLAFFALLLDCYPTLASTAEGELLAAFDVMLRDRVGRVGGGGGGEESGERKDGKGGRAKDGQTGAAAEVQATLQFRVLLLQCIRRFVSLLAADANNSVGSGVDRTGVERDNSANTVTSTLSLPEPSSFSSYAAALHAAVTNGPSTTADSPVASELPSLAQLTAARPTPLKYVRRGGSSASGKPTKKATITSSDDTQLLASLDNPMHTAFLTTSPADTHATGSSPSSAFTAAVPLTAFVKSSVPLLIEYWLESLGGDDSAAQHSTLTPDSYQCAEACVSILHTYSSLPDSSGCSLQPFFSLLSAHVFGRFPVVSTSSAVSAADVDLISSINVHICHLIASFVPPAIPPSLPPTDSNDADRTERKVSSEHTGIEMSEVNEWTSEMLGFIGHSLFQASSMAQATAVTNGAERHRKRKNRGGASTTLLSSSHIGELLPILELLVGRLSTSQQQWQLDAFTAYYTSLHELSPSKLQCISLIASLLQPPTGTLCLSLGVGHAWLRSLPSLLISSPRCRPATIRLLQFVLRCWHDPQRLDLSPLIDHCTAFYCEHLLSVPTELQMAALSLLPYATTLSPPLLSAFATMFCADGVDGGVRCLMLEMVAVHRYHIGVGAYLSFLLSCLSSQRGGEKDGGYQEESCHQHVELVLVRLRELAADEALVQLLPASSPRRSPAELLVLLLSPTMQSLISSATDTTRASGPPYVTPLTFLTVIRCLCEQVQQSTRSAATAQLLPPSLVPSLTSLLSTTLLSSTSSRSPTTASPYIAAVVSLLCTAPFLLPSVLSRLLADVSMEGSGWLCDVLLYCLHSRLRRWLLSASCLSSMREAVAWLQQVGGVEMSKLQAIELLLSL